MILLVRIRDLGMGIFGLLDKIQDQNIQPEVSNMTRLTEIFNWMNVPDIDEQNIFYMAQKLGFKLKNEDVWIKSTWQTYKQYVVFTVQTNELFFIKRSWETLFLREVLALHLGCHVLDPELFVFNYLAGTYRAGFWRWKTPTPYLMTGFIHGYFIKGDFKKNPEDPLWHWFGRQYYTHLILSLYDVENRHFIIAQKDGTIKRLDLGLAFRNINKEYQGFTEYFGSQKFFDNKLFQKGLQFEKEIVQKKLTSTRPALLRIMNVVGTLKKDDLVDFDTKIFCEALKRYWEINVPELRLSEGW